MTADLLELSTAGVRVRIDDLTGRHLPALSRAAGLDRPPRTAGPQRPSSHDPDVHVVIEQSGARFDTRGLVPVTRGVWAAHDTVVVDNCGGSGFSQSWRFLGDRVEVRARWTPGTLERGARQVRSRFDALRSQVLLHYPALWAAGVRGLAPLHVAVLEIDGVVVMLAGPGGVGKSTLVAQALGSGARGTCDNLAVSDGVAAYGLREPLRLDPTRSTTAGTTAGTGGGTSGDAGGDVGWDGHRTTHGRREHGWADPVDALRPDLAVVVRRGGTPGLRPIGAEAAQRALVAGTYAAGELRRFWPLTAALGLATGIGPVHPAVEASASHLSRRCRCLELDLGSRPGVALRDLLADELERTERRGSRP